MTSTTLPRNRVVMLVGVIVLVLAGAGTYVGFAWRQHNQATANATTVATREDLAAITTGSHIVFRNTALGDGYGRAALVPLSDPGGRRAMAPVSCERIHATAAMAICLTADRGLVTTYRATLLDRAWAQTRALPMTGLPNRARTSADGSLAATTTFVYGDSYANPGQFSTRTTISRSDGSMNLDLEEFTLLIDGRPNTAADRNLWGVTFADNDRFYATAATGGRTWLVRGSISGRTLTAIRDDVECPSLSPDKKRLAFKKHGDLPQGQWRLAVLDLATGAQTLLAEVRSVDDQAEWLNDQTVIYGLPRQGEGTASSDIWAVPADGTGSPTVLISDAWSPAVIR